MTGAIGGAVGKLFVPKGAVSAMLVAMVIVPLAARAADAQMTATTKDFAWLAGRWEGTMASGAVGVADVTFTTPTAGLIAGVMRLVADQKILVVELIAMTDTPRGPELRFRHFSNSLEAYESTFRQAMRLTSHDATRSVFDNDAPYDKALMSTQPRTTMFQRHDDDSFTGRTNIINTDGTPGLVEVRYRRVRDAR